MRFAVFSSFLRRRKRVGALVLVAAFIFSINLTSWRFPFEYALIEGGRWLLTSKNFIHSMLDPSFLHPEKEHIEALTQENIYLRNKLATFYVLYKENAQLKKDLRYVMHHAEQFVTAPLLSKALVGGCFTVGVGAKDGIEKGQAVIALNGLVGRIDFVGAHTARVMALTHVKSRIPVMHSETREQAILVGNGTIEPHLIYENSGKNYLHKEGILVTSGFGGFFKEGVVVGHFVRHPHKRNFYFMPMVPLDRVCRVHVVKRFKSLKALSHSSAHSIEMSNDVSHSETYS